MKDTKLRKYMNQLYDAGYQSIDSNQPVPEYEVENLVGLVIEEQPPFMFPKLIMPIELIDRMGSFMRTGHDIDTIGEILDILAEILITEYKPYLKKLMDDLHKASKPKGS